MTKLSNTAGPGQGPPWTKGEDQARSAKRDLVKLLGDLDKSALLENMRHDMLIGTDEEILLSSIIVLRGDLIAWAKAAGH
jgi:hypothetical protein